MWRIWLVAAKVCDSGFGREDLEYIEGNLYDNLDDAKDFLKATKPSADISSVSFVELHEFTKDWNDTDDDGSYLPNVMETFIGYIFTKK